ncbi:MAG: GGDEF domain-containing protein, partial [Clostridia bacterium]|nr:GGDEF domain-containing protein [Clostridia bacterium]
YLKFIMTSLNITVLAFGVFFVIYFLSKGIFSFTVFLLVVYLLSLSYIVRPCYFTIIYFLVFAALLTHIFSSYESSSILISEILISGVFLLLMAAGSSLSYSRYWKLFRQEKEIEEINRKLELVSQTDELTGLFNRRRMMDEIEKQIAYSQRYKNIFSIAMLDIDYFKNINDTYGHDIGDVVLREFSGLLSSKLRLSDFFGRWGGEEFVLLLPGTTPDDSFILLTRLQNDIGNHIFPNGIKVAFSAGICGYQTGANMNNLIQCADQALYSAKANGRNRTEIYSIAKE